MEITVHNVLDGINGSGDYTLLGVGGLELPASDETIEALMKAAGVIYYPYTAASSGYYYKLKALNGKILGNHRLDELNQFARYLETLTQKEREELSEFAERRSRLTPAECMHGTRIPVIDNDREFTVALIPEQYHSVPSMAYLQLPATDMEFADAIDRARTDGVPLYIEVRSIRRAYLKDCLPEYPNVYELNLLAQKLQEMSSGDETLYKAMLKRESKPIETARLINLTHNLEQCVVAPVSDFDALGRFAVDNGFWDDYNNLSEEILSMLDYDQLGHKFHKEQEGCFVDDIYIVCLASEDELQMPYKGNPPMPEPYPRQIIRLLVDNSPFDGQPVYLDLPAPDREINETAERLGVNYLSDYPFKSMQSIVPQLDSVLSGNENIYELSDFAEVLENLQWHGQMSKFKAILEREKPRCLQDFIDLSGQIDSYNFQPEIVSPYDYGEYEMLYMYKLDHTSHGMKHFDFAAFGRECMEQNYALITPYGLIQKVGMEQTLEPTQETTVPEMEMNMF